MGETKIENMIEMCTIYGRRVNIMKERENMTREVELNDGRNVTCAQITHARLCRGGENDCKSPKDNRS